MRNFLFREDRNQLVFFDNLEIIELNEESKFLIKLFQLGYSLEYIIKQYSDFFNIDLEKSEVLITDFLKELQTLDVNPYHKSGITKTLHTPIVHIIQNCNSPCVMCDCWKTRGKSWQGGDREIMNDG